MNKITLAFRCGEGPERQNVIHMEKKLILNSSPHLNSGESTRKIMFDVILALAPSLAVSTVVFGPRALLVMAVCVAACVGTEYLTGLILKKSHTIFDLSAVVTGLLLAMNLTVTVPLWMAALGGIIAIAVVKQLFGGIGQNFVNPALTARIILMVSFPAAVSNYVAPFYYKAADAVSAATPMSTLKDILYRRGDTLDLPSLMDMFLGLKGGCLGEVSVAALLIGGVYLIVRRVISPIIPLTYIGTVWLLSFLAGAMPMYQILSGGLFIGAFFMATDYTTSPMTVKGKYVMGIGCGLITVAIRLFGVYPEGVSFSILIMNILTPLIERGTMPRPFGAAKARKGGN